MDISKIKKQFDSNVAGHEMRVLEDNGVFRNLEFRTPGESFYWFGITTWGNHLTIYGDMGTYVFSRIPDMFNFFRGASDDLDGKIGYWSEKLLSVSRPEGFKRFSPERAEEEVMSYLEGYPDKEREALIEEVTKQVLACTDDSQEFFRAVYNFTEFTFDDFEEESCMEYKPNYIWCLHAIVWAIKQYDASKK